MLPNTLGACPMLGERAPGYLSSHEQLESNAKALLRGWFSFATLSAQI